MSLESLRYARGSLQVIDQLKLPHECEYVPVTTSEEAWSVIKKMQVRGAPLIAIVAMLGLAVDANANLVKNTLTSTTAAKDFLLEKMKYLRTSRPTAVNLFVATDELKILVETQAAMAEASAKSVLESFIEAAEEMLKIDVATNKSIGNHGAKRILELTKKDKVKNTLLEMTHYFHGAIARMTRMDAPVIIGINGTAGGGGFSLAITGDIIFANLKLSGRDLPLYFFIDQKKKNWSL